MRRRRPAAIRQRQFQLEQLEARDALAAAIWNNVIEPLNVDGDQGNNISPIDALLVINEINTRTESDARSGSLPKQTAQPKNNLYLDVNCDSFASPIDALLIINHINSHPNGGGGTTSSGTEGGFYRSAACSPQLVEGSGFNTELTRELVVPDDSSAVQISFQAPAFDATSQRSIRDAFEIDVTDLNGNLLAVPYAPQRTAALNWSEDATPQTGSATTISPSTTGGDWTATIKLNGVAAGTHVRASMRLVNNDHDDNSSIIIRGFDIVDSPTAAAADLSSSLVEPLRPTDPIRIERFADFTTSLVPTYGRTSLADDSNELITEFTVQNQTGGAISGRILIAIDNISQSLVNLVRPDGMLPDGRPYFEISKPANVSSLAPGQIATTREIRFRNLSGKRFDYQLTAYAETNAAPGAFSSVPITSIEAGRTYRYTAHADDPDGQAIRYALAVSPEGMTIDEVTGQVQWPTKATDVGTHTVIIVASDTDGATTRQRFDVSVLGAQANRPPNFVTDPITQATTAGSFDVITQPAGKAPGALIVGKFGSANASIASISQANQTIDVLAGLGHEKFAEIESQSTGQPPITGKLIQGGTRIDLGLSAYQNTNRDTNKLDGFASGDLNGDGFLDTIAVLRTRSADINDNRSSNRFVAVNLGAGDGTFALPVKLFIPALDSQPEAVHTSVSLADINNDGRLDIIALEQLSTSSRILTFINQGDGLFDSARHDTTSVIINSFKVADLNGDGRVDLLALNRSLNELGVLIGRGDGSFGDYAEVAPNRGGNIFDYAYNFGDLDGDGDLDVVVGDWPRAVVDVYLNGGNATFTSGPTLPARRSFETTTSGNVSNVLVGDFTGDGKADVLYTTANGGPGSGGLAIYVGNGSGTSFTLLTPASNRIPERMVNYATSAAPVDMDGDGDLDFVMVGYSSARVVSVGLNDGTGRFDVTSYDDIASSPQDTYATSAGAFPMGALTGDFNRDGYIDVLVAKSNQDFDHDFSGLSVMLADRAGHYSAPYDVPMQKAAFGSVEFVMAGDFNNDGFTDIWGPQYQGVSVTRLGNGDGTFQAERIATPYIGNESLAPGFVADINGDGNLDVMWIGLSGVQGGPPPRTLVGLGNGDGTFRLSFAQPIAGTISGSSSPIPGDFNEDGVLDFAIRVANSSGTGPAVEVLLGDPANLGTFQFGSRLSLTTSNSTLAVGYFDGDRHLDVAAVDTDSTGKHYLVVGGGDGRGNLNQISRNQVLADQDLAIPRWFAQGDINEDGHEDLVLSGSYSRSAVFLGTGAGSFKQTDVYSSGTFFANRPNIGLADVDSDGHLDMINVDDNRVPASLTIRHGLGDGTFTPEERYDATAGDGTFNVGDFNDDGRVDLALYSLHATTTSTTIYPGAGGGLVDLVESDLNGDTISDILAINEGNSHVTRLISTGAGTFRRLNDLFVDAGPVAIKSADFNGDGRIDFVTANRSGRSLSVMRAGNNGTYSRTDIDIDGRPVDLDLADIDGDGILDILVLDALRNAVRTYKGTAQGSFSASTIIPVGEAPLRLTTSDVNGDGRADLAVSLALSNRIMISTRTTDGHFAAPVYVALPSTPGQFAFTDLNMDALPDLVVTLPEQDQVAILYGLGSARYTSSQLVHVGSKPQSLVVADINADGLQDVVVNNREDGSTSIIVNRFDPTQVYRYQARAMDPDDDPVTYKLLVGPDGMLLDSATGLLRWTPGSDQIGSTSVVLQAADGRGGQSTQSFNITVTAPRTNARPVLTTAQPPSTPAESAFHYQVHASDSDGDALRYRLESGPAGATLNPVTGEIDWDPRQNALAANLNTERGAASIQYSPALDASSVTLEGWFQFAKLENAGLIWKAGAGSNIVGSYGMRYLFGALRTYIGDGTPEGQTELLFGWQPVIGQWYHLASTFDSATGLLQLLINGQVVNSVTTSKRIGVNNAPLFLGYLGGGDHLRGSMSSIRIWNQAFPAAAIAERMSQFEPGTAPGLIANFSFNEADSQTIHDASASGLVGKLTDQWPVRTVGLAGQQQAEFVIRVEDGKGGFDSQTITARYASVLRSQISGTVFADSNSDGIKQSTEAPLAGWTVYLDQNGNAVRDADEPSVVTSTTGTYRFSGLVADQYAVRVENVAGFDLPLSSSQTLAANTQAIRDIAVQAAQPAVLRGRFTIVDPVTQSAGEPLKYWRAYIDLNNNQTLDHGEPTAQTDSNGEYSMSVRASGRYSVRPVVPPGWRVRIPDVAAHDVVISSLTGVSGLDFTLERGLASAPLPIFIVSEPTLSVVARQRYLSRVTAVDTQGESIRFSLSVAPAGMVIDAVSGDIAWIPARDQVGQHRIIVRAETQRGAADLQSYPLTVLQPNTPLLIIETPRSPAVVGKSWFTTIGAQDAESGPLVYRLLQSPAGARIDAASGVIDWTPTSTDQPVQRFRVVVEDQFGLQSQTTFEVSVTTTATSAPFTVSVPRSSAFPTVPYYSYAGGKDAFGAALRVQPLTVPQGMNVTADGTLRWLPMTTQVGPQVVRLRYISAAGETEEREFDLTVSSLARNHPPSIVPIDRVSTTVDTQWTRQLEISDSDQDAHLYELISAPPGMSVNSITGLLAWNPQVDQIGTHQVTVRVTDIQMGHDELTFSVDVRSNGGPPRITSTPVTTAVVGQTLLMTVQAVDSESDPITYAIAQGVAGMTINSRTGEFSWTPTASQIGDQAVMFVADDRLGGSTSQAFVIRVTSGQANQAPRIDSEPVFFASVGASYIANVHAVDPEGTAVTYALRRAPQGMTINADTGAILWTPTTYQVGRTIVAVTATDSGGAAANQSFFIDVSAINRAPTITSTPTVKVSAGAMYRYDLVANDADRDPIHYELVAPFPANMSVDAFGRLRWQTARPDLGSHAITVRAIDARGGQSTQSFNLEVQPDTSAPRVTVLPAPGGWPWDGPIAVFVSAVDDVGVTDLELKVNGRVVPLDANRSARLSFEEFGIGTLTMVATARDAAGNIGTGQGFSFYRNPDVDSTTNPDVPIATISSPTESQSVTGMVQVRGTAAGGRFASYRLSYSRADQLDFHTIVSSSTAVTSNLLGTWDTSLLENDSYILRLEVQDVVGSQTTEDVMVGLTGNLKLGNFRLSFEDMTIPLTGLPLTVTRVYDSLQSGSSGDLGYGWRLEYRNTDLRTSLPKSGGESIGIFTPFKEGVKIYLNLPGQARQGFTFTPQITALPGYGQGNDLTVATPRFTPDPGNTNSLSVRPGNVFVNALGEMVAEGGLPWNPASEDFGGGYTVTTAEGVRYSIDGLSGLMTSATEPNGTRLTFTDFGVQSSAGNTTLTFQRDARGRIVRIIDPAGNSVRYAYSNAGDLVKVTDRDGNTTEFRYRTTPSHYLEQVIDPLGRTGIRAEYDADGRIVRQLDGGGNTVSFTYDLTDQLVKTKDARGFDSTTIYDNRGNVVQLIDSRGGITRYVYDENNNRIATTDPLGATSQRVVDSLGNVVRSIDALGAVTEFTYSELNRVSSTTDPLGRTTQFEYDNRGNLVRTVNALGQQDVISVDRAGNVTSAIDSGGLGTTLGYDGAGRRISQTDSRGLTVHFQYDANGNLVSQGSNDADRWNFQLTAGGRITSASGLGSVHTFTYDAAGQVASGTSGGDTASILYDAAARPTAIKRSDGTTAVQYVSDANGNTTSYTSSGGLTMNFEYDELDRVIRKVAPNGAETRYVYDLAGNVVKVVDPKKHTTEYSYDALGRLTGILFADGTRMSATYDLAGNRTSITDQLGQVTRYKYDALNRLELLTWPDGATQTYTFDVYGNRASLTDETGKTTHYVYEAGLLVRVIDALGNATNYAYDASGNLTGKTDALGRTTRYNFNALGSLVETIYPDGSRVSTTYDTNQNATSITTSLGTVNYEYDSADNRIATILPGGTRETATYNNQGLLQKTTDAAGTTTYLTDPITGLVRSVTEPGGATIRYDYDLSGLITLVGHASSASSTESLVRYAYDELDRLLAVSDSTGVTGYIYDGAGYVRRIVRPNNTVTTYDYDVRGNLTRVTHSTADLIVFGEYVIERDAAGRQTSVRELDGTRTKYAYDAKGQLIREQIFKPSGALQSSVDYTYDAVGNRISRSGATGTVTYRYNELDQLVAGDGWTYTYDGAGNLRTATSPTGEITTYTFDVRNRLVSIERASTRIASYEYDPTGLRRAETTFSGRTTYLYDRQSLTGVPQIVRTHPGAGGNDIVSNYADRLLSQTGGAEPLFSNTDSRGSVALVTNASGLITNAYRYSAGGVPDNVNSLGGMRSESYDSQTGLYYLRARYYDPALGRFLSRDPASGDVMQPISFHPYQFADNDPVNKSDPTGRYTLAELQTALKIRQDLYKREIIRFSNTVQQTLKYLGKTGQFFGGVMGLVTLIDLAQNGPGRGLKWFGLGGFIEGEINSGKLTFKLLSDQSVEYSSGSYECVTGVISSTTGQRVHPAAFVENDSNPLGRKQTIELCAGLYLHPAVPRTDVNPENASIAGIIVHEFTHLLLNTRDYEYGCKAKLSPVGLNRNFAGQFDRSAVRNADSYRCYFEDGFLSGLK